MKLLKYLFIFQLLAVSLVFSSCSDDDDNNDVNAGGYPTSVLGSWSITSSQAEYNYIFQTATKGLEYKKNVEWSGSGAVADLTYSYNQEQGLLSVTSGSNTVFQIKSGSYKDGKFTATYNGTEYTATKLSKLDQSIIGTWVNNASDEVYTYKFNQDGSALITMTYQSEKVDTPATYTFDSENRTLILSYKDGADQVTETFVILTMDTKKVLLQGNEGQETWNKQ